MKKLKIKVNKKVRIISSIILCLILIFGIYLLRHPMIFRYEKDYFGKVGLPKSHLYESVVEKMGEPLRIEKTENGRYIVHYNGLELGTGVQLGCTQYVKVTGKQYRFGIWKIGVGSTRKEIESVYRHKIKWSEDNHIEVCDGETWILFEFDENNIVKYINFVSGSWA